jgi:hypothetical protein
MNCYSIVKQTGTHADTLAAVGAADDRHGVGWLDAE